MSLSSQTFESYLPVYDVVPEKWEDARQFLVETLKKISNVTNDREIGFFLDEELLTGKQFIGTVATPQEYRSVFRKVLNTGALIAGANTAAHGINFDSRFTLVDMWVSATNSVGLTAVTMSNPQNVTLDATNINITSLAAYDRSFSVIEYMLEV